MEAERIEELRADVLDAVMESVDENWSRIVDDTKNGVFNTTLMKLPFDKTVTLSDPLHEKLKFTGLYKNLEHNNYSIDLNELWLHLSREEIREFFKTVLDQARKVEIDIADKRIAYTDPDFLLGLK